MRKSINDLIKLIEDDKTKRESAENTTPDEDIICRTFSDCVCHYSNELLKAIKNDLSQPISNFNQSHANIEANTNKILKNQDVLRKEINEIRRSLTNKPLRVNGLFIRRHYIKLVYEITAIAVLFIWAITATICKFN